MAVARFQTILVAVAEPAARRQPAVDRAVQLAKAFGAHLVLFHAAFDSALSGRPFFDSTRLAKSRGAFVAERTKLLERHARGLRDSGLSVDVRVAWEEPVHEAIIRAVLRDRADLVVAGRHERRPDRPPQLRFTDWELMRLCPRPLLLVKQAVSDKRRPGAMLAALDPMHSYDKPASLDVSIVGSAAAIASALQAECHAMHCVPRGAYALDEMTAADRKRFDERMRSRMKRSARKAGADVAAMHVVHGDVPRCLLDVARQLSAQMLAMGIVSRRWLRRFVIGDTAESVIRDVPCDLLLIKPESFRLRLGRARKEAIVLPKVPRRR